jgi:Adenylate and Guanylate cyclase catalytic domain/Double zinc ribbon/AAA ATPase domain
VRCPRCGHDDPDGARFCLQCGARLAISCGDCGVVVPPGARFCPECGHALAGAPAPAGYTVLAALGVAMRAEVKVRMGINSGLVVVGAIGDDLRVDYTAFGDTTVLAARLQAAAAPGAVLVSQQTAGLARGYFQLEEVAPVGVKERTVYPLRVMGLGTRTARIASGDEMSPFTGRDRELAELQRALEVAADGEGQVVGMAGDPGLGKSRLALEFRRLADRTRLCWKAVACPMGPVSPTCRCSSWCAMLAESQPTIHRTWRRRRSS